MLALELAVAGNEFRLTLMELAMMAIIDYRPVRWIPLKAAASTYYLVKKNNGHEILKKMMVKVLKLELPANRVRRLQILRDLLPEDPEVVEDVHHDTYDFMEELFEE